MLSAAVINITTKTKMGRKALFHLTAYSPLMKGSQSRDLEAGDMEEPCLLA